MKVQSYSLQKILLSSSNVLLLLRVVVLVDPGLEGRHYLLGQVVWRYIRMEVV